MVELNNVPQKMTLAVADLFHNKNRSQLPLKNKTNTTAKTNYKEQREKKSKRKKKERTVKYKCKKHRMYPREEGREERRERK